jgi:hypothetical protein
LRMRTCAKRGNKQRVYLLHTFSDTIDDFDG